MLANEASQQTIDEDADARDNEEAEMMPEIEMPDALNEDPDPVVVNSEDSNLHLEPVNECVPDPSKMAALDRTTVPVRRNPRRNVPVRDYRAMNDGKFSEQNRRNW
ncbi:hypothetical protein L596_000969 [Steinernema carpocapsae]|uniref:Uncharacterized protein n=1 Tax=Steinernema carpocapsae TaxID=34508 RepID=A0A4U8UK20_STECR|nr:hypothetical protein L596_000969 [Steinernema carpocapsae]